MKLLLKLFIFWLSDKKILIEQALGWKKAGFIQHSGVAATAPNCSLTFSCSSWSWEQQRICLSSKQKS